MRNVSDEGSREIKNTHFMFNYFLFPKIMPSMIWKKKIYCTAGNATCSKTKATNTDSEYVILIAFPLPQRLHQSASILRYTLTHVSWITPNLTPNALGTNPDHRADRPLERRRLISVISIHPVGTRFFARPDRPWSPPSLLYNGYRAFPGGTGGRGVGLSSPPHLVPKS